eukprot:PhM_4_TR96/c0_g1_i1/m.22989
MLRRTQNRLWLVAAKDDANAPGTTFNNVKPNWWRRLWRQMRHRAYVWVAMDEEWISLTSEGHMCKNRMEQLSMVSTGYYGGVPGSYTDPTLYQNKNSSPFRWGSYRHKTDTRGSWMMDTDEIFRLKEWAPKNPDDVFEMPPKPANFELAHEETIDEHGNRTVRHKYKYDILDPHGGVPERYPFVHQYVGAVKDHNELWGFKQGELLRCNDEEEEVLRRIMYEEDREWEMIKGTEIIQEPWYYPGKIRSTDLIGAVDRAKARWKKKQSEGKPTNPEKDPEYDWVQAGEFVEPRDGDRAEWRHLWLSNRKGAPPPHPTTGNYGNRFEDNVDNLGNDHVDRTGQPPLDEMPKKSGGH